MNSDKTECAGFAIGARPSSASFGSQTHVMSKRLTGGSQVSIARSRMIGVSGYMTPPSSGSTTDPLSKSRSHSLTSESKNQGVPEEKIRTLEKKVRDLIEESCVAKNARDLEVALQKAKEAGRHERTLASLQEQSGSKDNINLGLTYSVLLNLANQYENNKMHTDALNTYQVIMKDRRFSNGGILRVNMGNIYYKQKNYTKAIKFYQIALDKISNVHMEVRMKVMQNIARVFVHIGQYSDAIKYLEHIMTESPDVKTGFHLILCYYAIGDAEMMKKAFQDLVSVALSINDKDKYMSSNDDSRADVVTERAIDDALYQMKRNQKALAQRFIVVSAKLIAPVIEASFANGLDWCMETLSSSHYVEPVNELQLSRTIISLRHKDCNMDEAMETLHILERKDSSVKSAAVTNLATLYFLDKDYDMADRYSDLAVKIDSTNPAALVNKGNTVFIKQKYEKAAALYKEALRSDSSSNEALYNLGLSYKRMNRLEDALDCFLKLHGILRHCVQVMYQLAHLYELLKDPKQAIKWLLQVISSTPTDAKVLAKLGELYDCGGDEAQALQYYYESFRCFPSNIDVIGWLGIYYFRKKLYQKAIEYFQRATVIEPSNVKLQLLVAGCHKKSGDYKKALDKFKDIHHWFPENAQCLHELVRLCTDMELREGEQYTAKLNKIEKMNAIRELTESTEQKDGFQSNTTTQWMNMIKQPPEPSHPKDLDVSYKDPVEPVIRKPKISAKKPLEDVSFTDVELKDYLLP